jgi:hypothetical protein
MKDEPAFLLQDIFSISVLAINGIHNKTRIPTYFKEIKISKGNFQVRRGSRVPGAGNTQTVTNRS